MRIPSIFSSDKADKADKHAAESQPDASPSTTQNAPGLIARMTTPRPPSSGRGSTPSPQATTPEFKPKRLIKSASSNMLRKASPSSPRLPAASTFGPEKPRTRDNSPVQKKLADTGRRALSSTFSGSFGNQSPGPSFDLPASASGGHDRGRLLKRMSFMARSRPVSKDKSGMSHTSARVLGETRDYDVTPLLCCERVEELWNDTPNCIYIYLFGPDSPPSFKIPSFIIDASPTLNALAYTRNATTSSNQLQTLAENTINEEDVESMSLNEGYPQLNYGDIPNPLIAPPPRDGHLHLPSVQLDQFAELDGGGEADRVIGARNLFAFLLDKPLIATKRLPTEFEVFFSIAKHLDDLGFFDERIGDYGLSASTAFKKYMEQFDLQDMRGNSDKILKGVILGERMRSTELYYDAFTHMVGNFSKVKKHNKHLYEMISMNTRRRMEREYHELEQRQTNIGATIDDFDFPHIFNGSAQSKMTAESRVVNFSAWKQHFGYFRHFILSYYKDLYGSWPPKANKKNGLTVNGLNRLVLQQLYSDLCVMYDLIVDRDSLTTRKLDVEVDEDEEDMTEIELEILALRKIMSEHDRSSIPMSPPMPFDLPKLPCMSTIDAAFDKRPEIEQKTNESRKLKYFETTLIMAKAHNMDQGIYQPFLQAYAVFEQKESTGKSLKELRDMRLGHWLFLYAVLQRLPLLTVDAPNLRHKDGVEYFLCKSPIGPPPWLESSHGLKPHTDEVADNTPEGMFYRSHCWTVGSKMMQDYELRHPPPLSIHASFQESPYLEAVDEYGVPDFNLAQHAQAGMQQNWQGDYDYIQPVPGHPQRTESNATQGTVITNRHSAMPDLAIRTQASSQQRRTISQPVDYMVNDAQYGANLSNSAPVSPSGINPMRPPSRPASGYFGPGGIASRPPSRPTSRPVSRSGFVNEDYGRTYEGVPSSLGPGIGGAGHNGGYGSSGTPPLGGAESGSGSGGNASIMDPTGSVMGPESVAGGRSISQTRAVRMGPSTFDDILEGLEKADGKSYEKSYEKKVKGSERERKGRSRLSIFGSGGMGGSTSSLGSKG